MPVIALDIPRLGPRPFGMQLYIENMVRSMLAAAPPDWDFVIQSFGLRGRDQHDQRLKTFNTAGRARSRFTQLPVSLTRASIKHLGLPSSKFLYERADIVHSLGFHWVPDDLKNLVVTIQDVIPLTSSDGSLRQRSEIEERLLHLTQRAKSIVTISKYSQREIARVLGVREESIIVIPDGVDLQMFTPKALEAQRPNNLLHRFGLDKPYILYAGGIVTRKNVPRLLAAYDQFRRTTKHKHALAIVGTDRTQPEMQKLLLLTQFPNDVLPIGYLPPDALVMIFQNCDLFVFPSMCEGFGLPPLEAMACGVPVALSNSTALPEVGGDAAVYFDPHDVHQITAAMTRLIDEPELRQQCIDKGLQRARQMTWEKAAEAQLALYSQLLGSRLQPS